jgi:hypothetical protein
MTHSTVASWFECDMDSGKVHEGAGNDLQMDSGFGGSGNKPPNPYMLLFERMGAFFMY